MKDDFLALRDVGVTFADTGETALAGVSLTVAAGAFVAVVGRSGVGKSTLLRVIGGLLRPTTGAVRLQGANPTDSAAPVGIVFQRDNLMPWRTVAENVRLPLELGAGEKGSGTEESSPQALVADALAMVGLAGQGDSYPAQLSGGMAQRVAIARALVHRPALLLLDEPFGALDALTREHMADELLSIWQAHPVTVLMVTHSIGEAVLLADEVVVMNDRPGRITERLVIDLPRPRTLAIEATAPYRAYVAAVRGAIRD
ncbi:MAG: ABC transporter ATP-binding protein [Candidatus Promineofilum sp.]|nr:ABC transporter ATP-binding protein [Promineifilum sp.]